MRSERSACNNEKVTQKPSKSKFSNWPSSMATYNA